MEPLSATVIAIIAAAVILGCAILGLPAIWIYFWHRQNIAKIKGTQAQHMGALQDRLERLEKKCAEMQERITDAHMLIADEQRQLDKKLSESFPDIITPMPPIPDEPSQPASRRSNRERSRD